MPEGVTSECECGDMSDKVEMGPDRDPSTLEAAMQRIAELENQLDKALFDVGNLRLQLDMLSVTDTLTGLRNLNGIITAIERAAVRATRSAEPFALMSVDFPELRDLRETDRAGYDDAVRHYGSLISACLRRLDTVGRVDDSSFHVVLPMLDEPGIPPVLDRIGRLVERMPLTDDSPAPTFTILLSNPAGTNDVKGMIRELATARERAGNESPVIIRAKAVVEEHPPRRGSG